MGRPFTPEYRNRSPRPYWVSYGSCVGSGVLSGWFDGRAGRRLCWAEHCRWDTPEVVPIVVEARDWKVRISCEAWYGIRDAVFPHRVRLVDGNLPSDMLEWLHRETSPGRVWHDHWRTGDQGTARYVGFSRPEDAVLFSMVWG